MSHCQNMPSLLIHHNILSAWLLQSPQTSVVGQLTAVCSSVLPAGNEKKILHWFSVLHSIFSHHKGNFNNKCDTHNWLILFGSGLSWFVQATWSNSNKVSWKAIYVRNVLYQFLNDRQLSCEEKNALSWTGEKFLQTVKNIWPV